MKRPWAIFVMVGCTSLLLLLALISNRPAKARENRLSVFTQTYIAVAPGAPVYVPRLITADGDLFAPQRLRGKWSVIFFGFTACPQVCPKTLGILAAAARDPRSGMLSGNTQAIFVSVDPEHDTPQQMRIYLQHFGGRILGLTGNRNDIDRFSREIGAGSQVTGSTIDHSTSLFVLDPEGRLAGILLRPDDPAQIVSDLATLRSLHGTAQVSGKP